MGVDFYGCEACGESRYEEYVGSCTGCGVSVCSDCVVNDDINSQFAHDYGILFDSSKPEEMMDVYGVDTLDNIGVEDGEIIDDSAIQPKYCPFCNGDKIDKESLCDFIITKYELDTKKEWKEYKKSKG